MYSNASDSVPTPSMVSSETPAGVWCSLARTGSDMVDLPWCAPFVPPGGADTQRRLERTPPPARASGAFVVHRCRGVRALSLVGLADLVLQEKTLTGAVEDADAGRLPTLD